MVTRRERPPGKAGAGVDRLDLDRSWRTVVAADADLGHVAEQLESCCRICATGNIDESQIPVTVADRYVRREEGRRRRLVLTSDPTVAVDAVDAIDLLDAWLVAESSDPAYAGYRPWVWSLALHLPPYGKDY